MRTSPHYYLEFASSLSPASAASYNITAAKEVILSAGSIASPQLLLLSGIGPSAALTDNGIPIKYDNPNVGANLVVSCRCFPRFSDEPHVPDRQDHPWTVK